MLLSMSRLWSRFSIRLKSSMSVMRWRGVHLSLLVVAWLGLGWIGLEGCVATAQAKPTSKSSQAISIEGEPVATLRRPDATDRGKPQFLEAEILPP